MDQETQDQKMNRILAKCWSDAAFKAQLLADPMAVLQAEGVDVPAGIQVRAVADTDRLVHLVVPPRPVDLSDAELEQVAGGKSYTINIQHGGAPSQGMMTFLKIVKQPSLSTIAWTTFKPHDPSSVGWTEDYSAYPSGR